MNGPEHVFEDSLVQTADLGSLRREAVIDRVERLGFCCVRGVVSPQAVLAGKAGLREGFDPGNDRPSSGESVEEIMGHFQKLTVVGVEPSAEDTRTAKPQQYVPRVYRAIYIPLSAEDRYGLHPVFSAAARLRNLVYGLTDLDFCIDSVQDGLWTAARVHHFPAGGGFMRPHRDQTLPDFLSRLTGRGFYQCIVVMSLYGEDFESGGAFIMSGKQRIHYERYAELGDVIVFDTRCIHGIEDIDSHRVFRTNSLAGRLSGLVSFYVDLRRQ